MLQYIYPEISWNYFTAKSSTTATENLVTFINNCWKVMSLKFSSKGKISFHSKIYLINCSLHVKFIVFLKSLMVKLKF